MKGLAAQRNWFDRGGADYAQYRPQYPPALAAYLADVSPGRALAVDVGCGSGQLTAALVPHFAQVLGLDPSASQLAHAQCVGKVHYACARAEHLPVAAGSAHLIVAAQAAHWFDLPTFYAQVRQIAAPGAVLALVSYGVLQLPLGLAACFRDFYEDKLQPHWPPQRRWVDEGYRTLAFPFVELQPPQLQIRHWWCASEFVGYISTWSAVRRLHEADQGAVFARFAQDLSRLWGDPQKRRLVRWPINLRVGVVAPS